MESKLTKITTRYHTFIDNQVLTSAQLNEFIYYFGDQDRLTRAFLTGVGTVCGFRVSRSGTNIVISQGVGITTDGDLLQLKEDIKDSAEKKLAADSVTYTHFKKFDDDEAAYAPFRRLKGEGELKTEVIDLYEILPSAVENSAQLSELANLSNMAVLLYLESWADDGDLCTAIDCDNQGIVQINRLRVLLLSKEDAEFVASNDSIFKTHNIIDTYFQLPVLTVKRVVLNAINSSKYEELKRAYHTSINSGNLLRDLMSAISNIVGDFNNILELKISPATLNSALLTLKSRFAFSAYKTPVDIQYRYDHLKDLVDTYNEIRDRLLDLKEICSPDLNAFPKHLMLGLLNEINADPKHLRHGFYRSPALKPGCDKLEKTRSLVLKFFELIDNYRLPSGDIKITPSNKLPELSFRSIPFYYETGSALLKNWDFAKTKLFREKYNLSYNTANLAAVPQIQEPLNYNTDGFDFYRIEGHQGKDYRDVLEELDEQKKEYGLSFDVKALSVNINSETLDIDDYECEFEDLKVLLKAWTTEQDCILAQVSSFFSGFSTRVPGANIREVELDLKSKAVLGVNMNLEAAAAKATSDSSFFTKNYTTGARLLTMEKAGKSVVSENMSTVEDTLGVEMIAAIEANKGGSANDIVAAAKTRLQEKLNTDVWNEAADLKDFVSNKSVELMAHTFILTQRMPLAVKLVDKLKVSSYKLSLEQLCSRVQKMKASYQSTNLSEGLRAFMGLLINQLSTVCCSGKKLEVLLDAINERKEQILVRLQLSKFIEQHPGLEHKAGVEPGGTFVLVYKNAEVLSDNQSITEKLTASNSLLSGVELSSAKALLSNQILNADKLTTLERSSVLRSATELLNYENYVSRLSGIESLEKLVSPSLIPNNTVIADFALPYMCCSDCAPINYIIARQPVTLRLERDKYCLLTDKDPVLYEVSPADGTVATNPEVAGLSIGDGKITVLRDAFPQEMLGKPIRFTVDSQVTDAVFTIYPGVTVDFAVPKEPTNQATHTFTPEGENTEGATYRWEFGDGSTSSDQTPTHTYQLPLANNRVTVSLVITSANKICTYEVEHDIVFVEIKPTIDIDSKEYCANDKTEYSFAVSPAGAVAEIAGPGVQKTANGFVFVPAAAGSGTFANFTVNGEKADVSLTVFAPPVAACVPSQSGNQLIISNTSKNASKFVWSINGSKQTTTNLDPIKINLDAASPTSWKIELAASGAEVCPPSRTAVGFTTKFVDETPVPTCFQLADKAIRTDLDILWKISPDQQGVIAGILEQTRRIYGGNSDFSNGVIDRMEEFLNGKANAELEEMFQALWQDTFQTIVEFREEKEVFALLIRLFELQMRLFYNILGCQSNEKLKEFGDIISSLLKLVQTILGRLKSLKVIFSDRMKEFIKAYAEKVSDLLFLGEHTKFILEQKLI